MKKCWQSVFVQKCHGWTISDSLIVWKGAWIGLWEPHMFVLWKRNYPMTKYTVCFTDPCSTISFNKSMFKQVKLWSRLTKFPLWYIPKASSGREWLLVQPIWRNVPLHGVFPPPPTTEADEHSGGEKQCLSWFHVLSGLSELRSFAVENA